MKGSGGCFPATPALYEEGTGKKAHSTSGFEAQRAKEVDAPLVEQRARRIGVLVAVLGAALLVLAVVLGGRPW